MALLAAYHFDDTGASTVLDVSGNGHHITLTGTAGAQVAGGRHGGALGKTGATMPVLPAGLLAASQSDDRTLMWDAKNNFSTWWIRWQDDAINSGTWGGLNISGSMAVQARNTANSLLTRPTATLPGTVDFHHYCATYQRSTGDCKIYRDGVLASTQSFADGTQLSTAADRIDLAEWSDTGAALDNLRIYNECLDAAAVAALAGTAVVAPSAARTSDFLPFF